MSTSGEFSSEDVSKISINPEPYVLIPALGETLDFSFSVFDGSRAIVKFSIYQGDLSLHWLIIIMNIVEL